MARKIVDNYKYSNLLIIKERCIAAEKKSRAATLLAQIGRRLPVLSSF